MLEMTTAVDEISASKETAQSAQEESIRIDSGQSVQDARDDSPLFSFINKVKMTRKGDLEQVQEEPGDETCVGPKSTHDNTIKVSKSEKKAICLHACKKLYQICFLFFGLPKFCSASKL